MSVSAAMWRISARGTSRKGLISSGDPYAGAHDTQGLWINKERFRRAGSVHVWKSSAGTHSGPGFFQMDFGGYKNFTLTERFRMQFRAEVST